MVIMAAEMTDDPEELMENLRSYLIELNGNLKRLAFDFTKQINHLFIDTGPPEVLIQKLQKLFPLSLSHNDTSLVGQIYWRKYSEQPRGFEPHLHPPTEVSKGCGAC